MQGEVKAGSREPRQKLDAPFIIMNTQEKTYPLIT